MPVATLPTGVDIYYESHGKGEPLVFIPATGLSCEVWKAFQVPELSKSLDVIIHDPRGCGRSSRVQGSARLTRWLATSSRYSTTWE